MSSCFNIFEGNDISCEMHGTAVMRPCVRCLLALDDIHDRPESDEQHLRQIMLAIQEFAQLIGRPERIYTKEVYREKQDLFRAAEDKFSCCLCGNGNLFWNTLGSGARACYLTLIFTFEPLQNLPLNISKIRKKTLTVYLSSDKFRSTWDSLQTSGSH